MRILRILWIAYFALMLISCAPSPVELAEAERIRLQASGEATREAIDNQYQAALNAQDIQRRYEVQDQVVGFWANTWIVAGVVVAALLVGGGVFVLVNMAVVTRASGVYMPRRAALTADLVHVDARTRTLPALVRDGHGTVLDTGLVRSLTAPVEADAGLALANAQVRAIGLIAEGAVQAHRGAQGDVAEGLARMRVVPDMPRETVMVMVERITENGSEWVPLPTIKNK